MIEVRQGEHVYKGEIRYCVPEGADFRVGVQLTGDRSPSAEGIRAARAYMDFRFPKMKGAPLVESRVCQYENTPDHHFLLDRHPAAENVWLAGGGSGHGYKMGPAVGEHVAELVLGKRSVDPFFALKRLA